MKHCTYCGKEYPDDVTDCPLDGNPVEPAFISFKHAKDQPEAPEPDSGKYEIPAQPRGKLRAIG